MGSVKVLHFLEKILEHNLVPVVEDCSIFFLELNQIEELKLLVQYKLKL